MSKRAIIYTRVSSKDQSDNGNSLNMQYNECNKQLNYDGFTLIKHFGNKNESAKVNSNRPIYQQMLNYLLNPQNKINRLYVYSQDRLSRDMVNIMVEMKKIVDKKIEVYVVNSQMIIKDETSLLNCVSSFVSAQMENTVKSKRVIDGNKSQILKGTNPTPRLPFGYERDIKKNIITNSNLEIIKYIFKQFSNGVSISQIGKNIQDNYLKVFPIKNVGEILRNPYYAGKIRHKSNNYELVDGKHQKVLSFKKFEEIQKQLKNKQRGVVQNLINTTPLKGSIFCEYCNGKLTSYQRKEYKYFYYKCKCNKLNISSKIIDFEFEKVYTNLLIKECLVQDIEYKLKEGFNSLYSEDIQKLAYLKNEYNNLQNEESMLLNLYLKKKISIEKYELTNDDIKERLDELNEEINDNNFPDFEIIKSEAINLIKNISNLWHELESEEKPQFLKITFLDKPKFSKESSNLIKCINNNIFSNQAA